MGDEERKSLKERVAAARDQRQRSQTIQEARRELQEAVEGLLLSKDFFEALSDGDGLGISMLRVEGYPQPRAAATWLLKSWEDWVKAISFFAIYKDKRGEAARQILAVIGPFNENEITREVLSGYFNKVIRPSQRIYQPQQFDNFLFHLVNEGLVVRHLSQPAFGQTIKWKGEYYGSSSQIKISRSIWPFIERVKRRVERYSELAESVLPRLQPLEDSHSLDNDLTSQNFQRLLTHADTMIGMMVIWDVNSKMRGKWDKETQTRKPPEDAGLLAVLVGRKTVGTSLLIEGWEADKSLPFSKEEIIELPVFALNFTMTNEITSLAFSNESLKRVSQEEREGWWRIQWLLNRWLSREGRYRIPALPEAQETPSR